MMKDTYYIDTQFASVSETDALILQLQELETENRRLKAEKKKLSDTVDWMHDLIWELIQKQRANPA